MPEQEAEVAVFLQGGPDTPEKMHALVNRVWEVTHGGAPQGEMLMDLSFLSGVAVAALSNYAKVLVERDALAHAVWMVGNSDTQNDSDAWWREYGQLYELAGERVEQMAQRGVNVTAGYAATNLRVPA